MNRIKRISFYCIMVIMTLLVIEGMAQAAYYIAYREFNGGGPSRPQPAVGDATEDVELFPTADFERADHPYYGYTRVEAEHVSNRVPPPRRQDGVVLIGLVGGSVGWRVTAAFANALTVWFRDNDIPLRPVVLGLAGPAMKQPQQVMQIANTLSLGGEYDIIVNLDGYNELIFALRNYYDDGVSPFFPHLWHLLHQSPTDAQKLTLSRIYALRQREERLAASAAAEPWRWSALYGIVNRYLRESAATQILYLNHELSDALSSEYTLHRYGPVLPIVPDEYELSSMALRVWYRSSVLLDNLSRTAGAEYYHFQQPNQYVPDSKPLSDLELDCCYNPQKRALRAYPDTSQLLRRLGDELRQRGINYYDLTRIFADNRETLYKDDCCHLNARGNELLAASMVQHLEPALWKRAGLGVYESRGGAVSADTALDTAAQEISPIYSVNKLYFDVSYTADGILRYSRDDCHPTDAATPFFLHITPLDSADLLSEGPDPGYNSYEVRFDRDGGVTDAAGKCVVEYELPDYAIATVRTGQYSPDTGNMLWQSRLTLDWGFAVERTAAGTLRYSRDNCRPAHLATRFFLHLTPVDAANLSPWRVAHGYHILDFFLGFRPNDGLIDAAGRCVIERTLPEYDIASIVTGQYIPETGRPLWETRVDFE